MYTPEIEKFLASKVIAVAGVSRNGELPANYIYKKLKDSGYEVYPVNPKTTEVDGSPCYQSLSDLPQKPDAVVLATPPEATMELVKACDELGISLVWIHKAFGNGSYLEEAVSYCQEKGIEVIPGGCPMMFVKPVDFAHLCFRWIFKKNWKTKTAA